MAYRDSQTSFENESNFCDLSEDLVEKILKFLPVAESFRLRIVCRMWNLLFLKRAKAFSPISLRNRSGSAVFLRRGTIFLSPKQRKPLALYRHVYFERMSKYWK